MAVYKCKMCGGDLEVQEGVSVIECDFCGIAQTVPTAKDENLQALFNRANTLRTKKEFDKAERLYERIVQADETQAEAYWGLILCKYGIEYVEDPKTFTRIPTCHRASYDSIISDEDYKSATRWADGVQRGIYEKEAKEIDRIQKEIVALSQKEEPYDVFICYKETDDAGRRTQDSVIANDIYYQLTSRDFKVFYAAISLEDKLGSAYEPCIFAALNSAKVMIVVGTKPEHFNAVWVKNEWSRYLKMMKNDRSKMLIPCYKDMDAYELPEEFAHLQAQDMGKIGFVNDVIRGITKVIDKEEKTEVRVVAGEAAIAVAPLLERTFLFLEDKDWRSAEEYCEKILDQDPKNAEAYLAKLMVDLHVEVKEKLAQQRVPFDVNSNYKKLIRFASNELKAEVEGYLGAIINRINETVFEGKYLQAKAAMARARSKAQYLAVAEQLKEIAEYKDARQLYDSCIQKANDSYKARIYAQAYTLLAIAANEQEVDAAVQLLSGISDYEDAADIMAAARDRWQERYDRYLACVATYKESQAVFDQVKQHLSNIVDWSSKVGYFQTMADGIEKDQADLKNAEAEISSKREKIAALQQERSGLGIFSGKRKKEIDATVLEMEECIKNLNGTCNFKRRMLTNKEDPNELRSRVASLKKDVEQEEVLLNQCKARLKNADLREAEIKALFKEEFIPFVKADPALLEELKQFPNLHFNIDAAVYGIRNPKDRDGRGTRHHIAAGNWHAMGVTADGKTLAVGDDDYNQCGDVAGWEDVVSVAAGEWYGLGLKKDGTVIAGGSYEDERVLVEEWYDIVSVAAGEKHAVGLRSDGTVAVCGRDDRYQASKWTNIKQVAAGNQFILGLKQDGTVLVASVLDEDASFGQTDVSSWKNIKSIAASNYHSVGLREDGTVVAVGDNEDGCCDVAGWSDIVDIKTGSFHTVGLRSDGTVVAVGKNDDGQCEVSGWRDIIAIAAGTSFTVGLRKNGTVVAVGENDEGQLNVSGWRNIVSIAASYYTFGIKNDGTVVVAADEEDTFELNEVKKWRNIEAIATCGSVVAGLRLDGIVLIAGFDQTGQCAATQWKDIVRVDMVEKHIFGITSNGQVLTAGDSSKFAVDDWHNIVDISAGQFNTAGVKGDGTVVVVGSNLAGQCNTENWSDIIAVALGKNHTVGLKSNGKVVAVGENDVDQCETAKWNNIIAIAAGKEHTVGLRADGTVVATGNDSIDNRCNVSGWKDIVEISAGDDYTMGLTAGGAVVVASDKDDSKHNGDAWKLF